MVSRRRSNGLVLDSFSIENHLAYAALLPVGVLNSNVKCGIAEYAVNRVFLERRGDAGNNLQAVVGGTDA